MKKIYVIGITGVIIWLMIQFPHIMLNPGELISDHQKIGSQCTECHDLFGGTSSAKCISCHKLSEIGKDTTGTKESILFHSKLSEEQCTSCHTDHKGKYPRFAISKFDHNLLSQADRDKCGSCHDQPTDNLHKQVSATCGNCHNTTDWKSDVKFNHDMIEGADKNNCVSCHNKPDDATHRNFNDKCADCHGQDRWVPSTFDHSAYFILDHDHNAECKTCHNGNDYSTYTCYGCHEHSESELRSEHNEEGIYDFNDCASCHMSGDEHDIRRNGREGTQIKSSGGDQIQQYIQSQKEKGKDKEDDDD